MSSKTQLQMNSNENASSAGVVVSSTRKDFLKTSAVLGFTAAVNLLSAQPASARGRATLEKSYQRYAPRVIAGGEFYGGDLRKFIEKSDWAAVKISLQEPPKRKKADLNKPDAGVAERARLSGSFSDSRVLNAADLFAGAFSDNSISPKTKKMQASVEKVRTVIKGLQDVAAQGLGESTGGGFLGLGGGKKASPGELSKQARDLYVAGGNAWNEYVFAANEDLAQQFDKFPFIK